MAYKSDREFTDYIHNTLALKIIYAKMGWAVQNLNERLGQSIDLNHAVDYVAVKSNKIITIQERFREKKYVNNSDFTIRYQRPENPNSDRILSEFFKLDADFFIYGIINESKENYHNASKFLKYAVVNLNLLKDLIEKENVIIDPELKGYRCQSINGKMHCPIINNKDHSSTFVPIDLIILHDIAPEVIVLQEGFILNQ